jgi:hypothetical protein
MWVPTRQEAVVLYARFCVAHYGINAPQKARSQAEKMGRQGDIEGEKIWGEVASEIENTTVSSLPLSWSSGV